MIRLLVIEDNANIIVPGLRNLFRPERDGIQVACVSESTDNAILKNRTDDFDLIILDLWLSNTPPLENLRKLRQGYPGKPILIYTQDDSPVWRRKMLVAGAGAYLTKNTPRDELKMAIVKVAGGELWFTGQISKEDQEAFGVVASKGTGVITPVQRRMAEMLTRGANREEIAKALLVHPSAVDKSFAKLRLQFQCKNNYELIRILMDNALL
jgi:DNA-binding NarL/FixJ family response regulator